MKDPPAIPKGRGVRARQVRRVLTGMRGPRLSWGKPVRQGDRTVIPVSSVVMIGGFGLGTGPSQDPAAGDGGGGGGVVLSRPAGYVELTDSGARFHRIGPHPALVAGLGAAFLAARQVRQLEAFRPRRLWLRLLLRR